MGNGNSSQPFLCAVDRGSALLYLMLFIHTVYIEKKKVEKHEHIPRTWPSERGPFWWEPKKEKSAFSRSSLYIFLFDFNHPLMIFRPENHSLASIFYDSQHGLGSIFWRIHAPIDAQLLERVQFWPLWNVFFSNHVTLAHSRESFFFPNMATCTTIARGLHHQKFENVALRCHWLFHAA